MTIGIGPNVSIDWEASEGNKVTFPIGLWYHKNSEVGKDALETAY